MAIKVCGIINDIILYNTKCIEAAELVNKNIHNLTISAMQLLLLLHNNTLCTMEIIFIYFFKRILF